MKQRTVGSVVEALCWIHNNAHNEVGQEFHPRKVHDDGRPICTHVYFANFHEKIRVPSKLTAEVFSMIRPNKRKFDTRMFALTRKGRFLVQ